MLVVVEIIYLMINISGSLIELMGVAMGNETKVAAKQNYSDLAKRLFVMPGHFVVYRIGLLSGGEEGQYQASVQVSTEFEELSVPFRFRVAKGSLSTQAQHLSFEPTFPVSGLHSFKYSCHLRLFQSKTNRKWRTARIILQNVVSLSVQSW